MKSRIEELETLVSNLRRDLQVAHDALHKAHQRLEEAQRLFKDARCPECVTIPEMFEWCYRRDEWLKEGK